MNVEGDFDPILTQEACANKEHELLRRLHQETPPSITIASLLAHLEVEGRQRQADGAKGRVHTWFHEV